MQCTSLASSLKPDHTQHRIFARQITLNTSLSDGNSRLLVKACEYELIHQLCKAVQTSFILHTISAVSTSMKVAQVHQVCAIGMRQKPVKSNAKA
jgi:hypothetical protein